MFDIIILLIFLSIPLLSFAATLWLYCFGSKWRLKIVRIFGLLAWSCLLFLSFRLTPFRIVEFLYYLSFGILFWLTLILGIKVLSALINKLIRPHYYLQNPFVAFLLSLCLFASLIFPGASISYHSKDKEFAKNQFIYSQKADEFLLGSPSAHGGFNQNGMPSDYPAYCVNYLIQDNKVWYIEFWSLLTVPF